MLAVPSAEDDTLLCTSALQSGKLGMIDEQTFIFFAGCSERNQAMLEDERLRMRKTWKISQKSGEKEMITTGRWEPLSFDAGLFLGDRCRPQTSVSGSVIPERFRVEMGPLVEYQVLGFWQGRCSTWGHLMPVAGYNLLNA